jgi:hypothetical protein
VLFYTHGLSPLAEIALAGYDCARSQLAEHIDKFQIGPRSAPPARAVAMTTNRPFQFVGHAFERKPPEFLKDWRFLFVGLRWWLAKLAGKA